jgi:hypothetical protein
MSSLEIKNISLFPKGDRRYDSARLTRQEGRIMIVTNVRWDAVDAEALETRALTRTAKSCGPDAAVVASSS